MSPRDRASSGGQHMSVAVGTYRTVPRHVLLAGTTKEDRLPRLRISADDEGRFDVLNSRRRRDNKLMERLNDAPVVEDDNEATVEDDDPFGPYAADIARECAKPVLSDEELAFYKGCADWVGN